MLLPAQYERICKEKLRRTDVNHAQRTVSMWRGVNGAKRVPLLFNMTLNE